MQRALHLKNINQNLVRAEYAVRGELAIRAEQLRIAHEQGRFPYAVVACNIGNPQQLRQAPLTFLRQVAALSEHPTLADKSPLDWPSDVVERVRGLIKSAGGSIGAYSHSQGIPLIRNNVSRFIANRDHLSSPPPSDSIFLTSGASQGVQMVLQTLIANDKVGVMIPIPQYPLYTASLALFNGRAVPYYLDEDNHWSLNVDELERSFQEAKKQGTDVRALCVIHPGNPTGNCLTPKNMEDIVHFCISRNLVLLADEVYQENIYSPSKPFTSFRKVVLSLGAQASPLELFSFHSTSKGVIGECGRRGGYFDAHNIDKQVLEQLYKLASICLCPPVQGQIGVDVMVNPPSPSQPSYNLYKQERSAIFESLKRRAGILVKALNEMEGVKCWESDGAMYAFPKVTLPPKAIREAEKSGKAPDAFYSMALLNATGICVVPGSGFGQLPGTFHVRITFLPPEDGFEAFIGRFKKFHAEFMEKYR